MFKILRIPELRVPPETWIIASEWGSERSGSLANEEFKKLGFLQILTSSIGSTIDDKESSLTRVPQFPRDSKVSESLEVMNKSFSSSERSFPGLSTPGLKRQLKAETSRRKLCFLGIRF